MQGIADTNGSNELPSKEGGYGEPHNLDFALNGTCKLGGRAELSLEES